MSTYVNRFFTAVSSALEFNTATLSGAIDIVVIEDDQGRRHSSPFHVRFGKLQLLKSRGIPVHLYLNGHHTSLRMLLGAAGEAYFYNPHHPSTGPQGLDTATADLPAQVSLLDEQLRRNHDLALPARAASQQLTPRHPLFAHATHEKGGGGRRREREGADMCSFASLPLVERAVHAQVVETRATDYPFGYISDSEVELTRKERDGTTEVVDEPRSPPLYATQRRWTATVSHDPALSRAFERLDTPSERHGSGRPRQRQHVQQHNAGRGKMQVQGGGGSSSDSRDEQNSALFGLPESPAGRSEGDAEKDANTTLSHEARSSPTSAIPDGGGEARIGRVSPDIPRNEVERVEQAGLGHGDDAFVTSDSLSDIVGEEDAKLECRSVDGYDADDEDRLEDLQEKVAYVLSRPKRLSFSDTAKPDIESNGVAGSGGQQSKGNVSSDDEKKEEQVASRDGVIQMSRCGKLIDPDMEEDHIVELFERHRVSFEEFSSDPSILHDSSLLFRIENRLIELRVAAPFIFSVLAFSERMDIDTLARDLASEPRVERPKSVPTPSRRFGWFGWSSPKVEGEPLLQKEDLDVLKDVEAASPSGDDGVVVLDKEKESQAPRENQLKQTSDVAGTDKTPRELALEVLGVDQSLAGRDTKADTAGSKSLDKLEVEPSLEKEIEAVTEAIENNEPQAVDADPEPTTISFYDIDPDALSLKPAQEELQGLDLKPGANSLRFVVESSEVELTCRIFLWDSHTKVVISDVDGTITRSDVLGHLLPAVGRDWSQVGVAGLYTQIEKNGYKILYLTARPIGQASQTRTFLHNVTQGSARLPNGPVLMSPNRLVESFTREVIRRKPHEFKIAALREVHGLFPLEYNPFHAGFGNRDTDVISYRAVGLVPHRIFVVNPKGELVVMKARYESTASYSSLQDLVESVFPDISGQGGLDDIQAITESATYNDWNFWREALPNFDVDELINTP